MRLLKFIYIIGVFHLVACGKKQIEFNPSSSFSGEVIIAQLPRGSVTDGSNLGVQVNNINADILTASVNEIRFLMPELEEGNATVRVMEGEKLIGEGDVKVLPHPGVKVLLSVSNDTVMVIGKYPVNKVPEQPSFTESLNGMAFQLMTNDKIVSQGIVGDFSNGMEVFPRPDGSIAITDSLKGQFSITVPAVKGQNEIRLFRMDNSLQPFSFLKDRQPWKVIQFQN
jgi:hypothetical protein